MGFFQANSTFTSESASAATAGHRLESSECSQATPVVFIVDEDNSVCELLAQLVAGEGWRPVIFPSAEAFLHPRLELVPSCLLLEVSLPGLSGLELQKRVITQRPEIPVIFLAGRSDLAEAIQAMKAGAVEFFTKPVREEELLSAMRGALAQSRVAVARTVEKRALQKRYASLTLRERQVLALVSSGWLNKQVGGELGISEITVKAHRGQVMRKMRANSLPDLVRMAERLGASTGHGMPIFRLNGEDNGSAERDWHGFPGPVMSSIAMEQAKSA
ncbi:MAG TPA: response regulator [Acidobacteriaceae bacterium]|nr:response regulator [Acidobacteriaceae bacterium]